MIRKATLKDIENILQITRECASFMESKGICQWNAHYPNKSAFKNDALRGELYVVENNNNVIGCIVISTFMDEVYKKVSWLTESKQNIYIHRLAVQPKHQGKGYAQKLMDFAEEYAIKNSYTSIRLDTFSQNKRNQKFYELRGYKPLDKIYFPKQSKHPFYCYELIL